MRDLVWMRDSSARARIQTPDTDRLSTMHSKTDSGSPRAYDQL